LDYSAISTEQLVAVCSQGMDQAAWREFVHRFQPLIAKVALRTARRWGETSPSIVDDLVQETHLKLCADNCLLLRNFVFRQPDAFYGFLTVVTTNIVHDYFKCTHAAKRGSGQVTEALPPGERSPEAVSPNFLSPNFLSTQMPIERTILIDEIDRQLRTVVPPTDVSRSRLVFWLYYRFGMSAVGIAAIPQVGLTVKGVETMLRRLTGRLKIVLIKARTEDQEPNSSEKAKGIPNVESF
jgi:RNA polymerase sigma-70 factor, ECF subfamily